MEKFKIGGVEFFLSKGQVEQKLNGVEPEAVREVYVEVDKIKHPIKQALAVATGLLRGGFTTHDAMRVFRKLGLPVNTASEIELSTMRSAGRIGSWSRCQRYTTSLRMRLPMSGQALPRPPRNRRLPEGAELQPIELPRN